MGYGATAQALHHLLCHAALALESACCGITQRVCLEELMQRAVLHEHHLELPGNIPAAAFFSSVVTQVLFDSGGMPSSHAALVVAVTTSVGIFNGLSSTAFPLALCFSVIVMYDAAGIRRHAGLQAQVRKHSGTINVSCLRVLSYHNGLLSKCAGVE